MVKHQLQDRWLRCVHLGSWDTKEILQLSAYTKETEIYAWKDVGPGRNKNEGAEFVCHMAALQSLCRSLIWSLWIGVRVGISQEWVAGVLSLDPDCQLLCRAGSGPSCLKHQEQREGQLGSVSLSGLPPRSAVAPPVLCLHAAGQRWSRARAPTEQE